MSFDKEVELERRQAPQLPEDEAPNATEVSDGCREPLSAHPGDELGPLVVSAFFPVQIPSSCAHLSLLRLGDSRMLTSPEFFELIIPCMLLEEVCKNKNKYRIISMAQDDACKRELGKEVVNGRRTFKELGVNELKAWLGLLLYMGT